MSRLEGLVVRCMTAAQQVADGLCGGTWGGAFSPGDRLRESASAAELGNAGNTVREAVRILELSGLVGYEVNRGAVTVSAAPEQLDSLHMPGASGWRPRLSHESRLPRRWHRS